MKSIVTSTDIASPGGVKARRVDPLAVVAHTATSALGVGKQSLLAALLTSRSGLRPNDFGPEPLPTWVGRVEGLEVPLPAAWLASDCRSNRLAWKGLQADGFLASVSRARQRFGAGRMAVFMGTSTSSIGATEEAYCQLDSTGDVPLHLRQAQVHTLHSLAAFVQQRLELEGPCMTVATACTSSAKTFAHAARMLHLGLIDAAVVGGVDTLCGHALYGFNALQLVSSDVCRPFDVNRAGISLGEAAGFALVQRAGDAAACRLHLAGYGESSDAHHMSAPHPEGRGAERALDEALRMAGISASEVDYLHLHGTGTVKNDEVEAALVARRFGPGTHASSTKGMTGHTLGTAGILGAVFSFLALETGWMAASVNCQTPDPSWGNRMLLRPARKNIRIALSNAFGFGGSNCVLAWSLANGTGR